jgi:hypothetical protein
LRFSYNIKNLKFTFLLIFIFCILLQNYIPGYDESIQLEATIRMLLGFGYNSSWEISRNLSKPYFKFLSAWPIGYSLMVFVLIKLGLTISFACKIIKISTFFININVWLKVLKFYINEDYAINIFTILFSTFSIFLSRSITDLLVITILGLCMYVILFKKNVVFLVLLSFCLISIKYTSLSLIPFLSICLLRYGNKGFLFTLVYLSLVLFFTVALLNFNYINTGSISTLTNKIYFGNIHSLKNIDILKIFYNGYLGSIQLPIKLITNLNIKIKYFILLVILFFIIILFFNHCKKEIEIKYSILFLFLSINIFLILVTFLFFNLNSNWIPLYESRYYSPIFPFLLIFFVTKFNFDILYVKLIFLISLFSVIIFFKYKYDINLILDNNNNKVNRIVNEISKKKPKILILDQTLFPSYKRNGLYNVYCNLPIFKNIYFTDTTFIFIATIKIDSKNKLVNNLFFTQSYNNDFEKFSKINQFNLIKISDNSILYWRMFLPGQIIMNGN